MLALFCMTKVTCAVAAAAAASSETQADSGFVAASSASATKSASRACKRAADAALIESEIKRHLEAIALYEQEASSSDVQVRAFAQRILPQLQRHLALLRSLKSGN
jgi:hypothetical protein